MAIIKTIGMIKTTVFLRLSLNVWRFAIAV